MENVLVQGSEAGGGIGISLRLGIGLLVISLILFFVSAFPLGLWKRHMIPSQESGAGATAWIHTSTWGVDYGY